MGVFEKLKNALFEVEYVEVEEAPKKEKKEKVRDKIKEKKKAEKPIAKKIVLPGKREQKIEELKEEELKADHYETRPLDEEIIEKPKEDFKFMDDNDFKVDVDVLETKIPEEEILEERVDSFEKEKVHEDTSYYSDSFSKKKVRESRPYGMDSSYSVNVGEYGTYDKRDEKTYFKPSPIISPIYGILDKNYKKEDVVQKREVHLSSYTRGHVSVDDIRDKAYGNPSPVKEEKTEEKFEVEEEEEVNKLVDLNDKDKPEVKEVTMGDAMEYFQDLGLEYNVDYVDVSKDKSTKKVKEEEEDTPKITERVDYLEEDNIPKPKIKDEGKSKKKKESISDDDNLFDLIDSMYQEKE